MKELADFQAKDSQVTVGDGILPVRKMFEALIAMKYKGFVDLEYEIHPEDPMPGVISSFAYIRGMLARITFHLQSSYLSKFEFFHATMCPSTCGVSGPDASAYRNPARHL
jgi:hypothetical protein